MAIRQVFDSYRLAERGREVNHQGEAALPSVRVRVTLARGVETVIQAEGPLIVHLAVADCGTALMVCLEHTSPTPRAGMTADQGETNLLPNLRLDVWA